MPPKKRGRKPKKKDIEKPPPKKGGRKPKGGKIIKNEILKTNTIKDEKPNIILHLKCKSQKQNDIVSNEIPSSFNLNINKNNNLDYNEIIENTKINYDLNKNILNNHNNLNEQINENCKINSEKLSLKNIWLKLDNLKNNLKFNNVSDKNSACFWCTCRFDNPTIYIPIN